MKIELVKEQHELFAKYDGCQKQQPCFIELDCPNRILTAKYNPELNAVPMRVHEGYVKWWSIPCLMADRANELLAKIAPLAEQICNGYAYSYSLNRVTFSTEAQEAFRQIEELCELENFDKMDIINTVDARDWFDDNSVRDGLKKQCVGLTDAEIKALAEAEEAGTGSNIILSGTEKFFLELRDE